MKTELRDGAVAAGQRQHQGLSRAAGQRRRQAARRARHPREPRPESLHRRRRAPVRRRQLHRLRAGRADLGRRLSRATTRRAASCSARSTAPRCSRTSSPRRTGCKAHAESQRQARRGRLLLRRRRRQPARGAACPISAAGVPFYGRQPSAEDVREDQGAAAAALRRATIRASTRAWPAYEAALKANSKSYEALHLRGHPARLPQRHDAALRRSGGEARVAAHARLLQQESAVDVIVTGIG